MRFFRKKFCCGRSVWSRAILLPDEGSVTISMIKGRNDPCILEQLDVALRVKPALHPDQIRLETGADARPHHNLRRLALELDKPCTLVYTPDHPNLFFLWVFDHHRFIGEDPGKQEASPTLYLARELDTVSFVASSEFLFL